MSLFIDVVHEFLVPYMTRIEILAKRDMNDVKSCY